MKGELRLGREDASLAASRETQRATNWPFLVSPSLTKPPFLPAEVQRAVCPAKCKTNYFVVLAKDRGCPVQRRPYGNGTNTTPLAPESHAKPSLPFPFLSFPSFPTLQCLQWRKGERDFFPGSSFRKAFIKNNNKKRLGAKCRLLWPIPFKDFFVEIRSLNATEKIPLSLLA